MELGPISATLMEHRAVKNKNALIYLVTAGLNSAVPFFTLPFLTRALSPQDFGIIASFVTLTMVAATLLRFEVNTVVKKVFSQTPELLLGLFGATLTFSLALAFFSGIFILGLWFSSGTIAGLGAGLWALILFVALARTPTLTLHNYWHVTRKVVPYALWSLLALGGTHFLTLTLALTVLPDWRARIFVDILVALISLCVAVFIMHRKHGAAPIWNTQLFANMGLIAAPIWPGALVITLLFSLDRIVLLSFVSMKDLGIYSVAVQFAAVITLLFTALTPPFEAWAYSTISRQKSGVRRLLFERVLLISGLSFGAVLILGPLVTWLLPLWVAPQFEQAGALVIPLMFAFCMFGLFRMLNICLICIDSLKASSAMSVTAFAINTGILLFAVPEYGIAGAAYGLLIGFGVATLLQLVVISLNLSEPRSA